MAIQTTTPFGTCACHEHLVSAPPIVCETGAAVCEDTRNSVPSRRRFLQAVTAGTVAGILDGVDFGRVRAAKAQSVFTPEAALKELMDGNQRYRAVNLTGCRQDLALLQQKTMEKQEPFAAVLSCADSRVPVELVFDQSIGELFVTRIAGNITTPEIIASLEYGAAVLGTKVIMVLGHGSCGAVKAAIDGKAVPGQISALYAAIRPAIDQAGANLTEAIKANAKIHATLLRQASPVIASLIKEKKLEVVAAYYDLRSGEVSMID
jgi:carbonic anhydrase